MVEWLEIMNWERTWKEETVAWIEVLWGVIGNAGLEQAAIMVVQSMK